MKKWTILRAILLSVMALMFAGRNGSAEEGGFNCCTLCFISMENFAGCNGCTITTLI